MATFEIIVREVPAGSEDFKIDLDSAGLFQSVMSMGCWANRTRTIPTITNRGFGHHPVIGQTDGFTTP